VTGSHVRDPRVALPSVPVLTFDIEEWFHLLECDAIPGVESWGSLESRVERSVETLLELLGKHGVHGTFFTMGWVAERHPEMLRRIAANGHEVGCHSHIHSLVHAQTPEAFVDETARALNTIAAAVSRPIRLYRAPGFSITTKSLWAFDLLMELGIEIDCSVFPGTHAHGGVGNSFPHEPFRIDVPGRSLHEFPASLARIGPIRLAFAGGGYFRLLPLAAILRLASRADYTMTYFHPRDFDADQPRISGLGPLRAFRAYVGIAGALGKLDAFLARRGGRTVSSANASIDWTRTPVFRAPSQFEARSTRRQHG
jgi:peptidoglycan-N-acetylglucosamine deacetylase